ncbi:MAG: zincin-like metallopeptidase domain-containing protein [Terriglobales bacterium]
MDNTKQPFHEAVAEKLIAQLRAGTAPWQKPWNAEAGLPFNPITGNRYRGINALQLVSQGREDPRWLTYKQASSLDAQVRRGEKGTPIQYWKFTEEQTVVDGGGRPVLDARGQPVKETVKLERPRVFVATVFNAAQIDGLPPPQSRERAWDPVERAERILEQSGAVFQHGEHDRAFYRPSTDTIHRPPRNQFPTAGAFYATALHELGHWTGHDSRLARDLAHPFGSEGYAREELRAEIASMILGAELGIGHDTKQHVAYVDAWIKVLQDDPLEIFRAAADAEKIHDYVLGLEQRLVQDQAAHQHQVAEHHAAAFFDNDNRLRAWDSGQPLPDDWQGVIKHRGAYWYIGREQGERSYTVLGATRYSDAQAEAERISVLAADIGLLLNETSFAHADSQPVRLEEAMRSRGLGTVGSVSGSDPRRFYQHAEDRLSPLFDLRPGSWGMDNASLARNEMAQAFAKHAAKLVGTLRQTTETDMTAPDQPVAQVDPDRAVIWTLGHLERNTLAPALDKATLGQLNRVKQVLQALLPLEPTNPFWQRQHLPDDRDGWDWKITQASELVASRQADAHVAGARLELEMGRAFGRAREGDADIFEQEAGRALGLRLPAEWNGQVLVEPAGENWDVVIRLRDQDALTVAQRPIRADAELLAERLALIDAHSTFDEHEKAIKFARVHEQRVRRDPDSSDDDIATAKQIRINAELAATLDDADLQRRIEYAQQDRAQQAAAEAARAAERVLIAVPFRQKEEAKALGAKWDRQQQSWYVPAGVDPAPFAKWIGQGAAVEAAAGQDSATARGADRIYLAVPYHERGAAKAAGAQWDTAAKSWYAPREADLAALTKWRLKNAPAQQGPAMSPREEFAEFLESFGCVISGDHPIMDGNKHRITVKGEKFSKNSGSGFYVGHLDGHPAGFAKNNKTGLEGNWKAKGYALDPAQKAQLAAEAAAKLQQRETELVQQQERAAARVATELAKLVPAELPTPYLAAKGLAPVAGVLTDRAGKKTYVPAIDVDGKVWTMQYIKEDGTKRFAKDSRKDGCFHVVGGTLDDLAQVPALVAGEGYATAAQLRQSLGFPTVAAFDSGNLIAVARALHTKYPDKPVVIAGDDDRHLELTQGVNPGRSKAEEAAELVGGAVLLPIFAPGENGYPAELEPVTPKLFREHERTGTVLSEQQLAALASMKQFTDFNDLANRSALGEAGVDRQVRAAVERVLSQQGVALEQGREQQAVLAAETAPVPEATRPKKTKRQRNAASVA